MSNANFWIATEANHTAAHTRKTLYVSGKQSLSDIVSNAAQHSITYVCFANCPAIDLTGHYYRETVDALITAGYIVSMEYDIAQHNDVQKQLGLRLFNSRSFIPIVSLGEINVSNTNQNLTLVVNDSAAEGRWCIGPGAITDSNRFVRASDFAADQIIKLGQKDELSIEETAPVQSAADEYAPTLTPEPEVNKQQVIENYVQDSNDAVADVASVESTVVSEPVQAPEQEATVESEAEAEPAQTTSKRKKANNAE